MATNKYSGLLKSKCFEMIFLIMLGVIFVVWPGSAVSTILKIIGILFITFGSITIIAFFLALNAGGMVIGDVLTMIIGIPLIALGVTILLKPDMFLDFQALFFGLVLLVHALIEAVQTYLYVRYMGGVWYVHLILTIVCMILAIIVLANPFEAASALVRFIGIIMIYAAISSLVFFIKTVRAREKF